MSQSFLNPVARNIQRIRESIDRSAESCGRRPEEIILLAISKTFPREAIAAAIESAKSQLGEDGRVLVRASGTEPLIRVMIEGKKLSQIEKLAEQIAKEFRRKC